MTLMRRFFPYIPCIMSRDGKVTFEKKLGYSFSYISAKNFRTIVTSVTVTTIKIWLEK